MNTEGRFRATKLDAATRISLRRAKKKRIVKVKFLLGMETTREAAASSATSFAVGSLAFMSYEREFGFHWAIV